MEDHDYSSWNETENAIRVANEYREEYWCHYGLQFGRGWGQYYGPALSH